MHIPDGFLSAPVWIALDVAAVPAVSYMVRRAQRDFDDKKVPLLGVMGAFVFAAQMINFPVGGGTSGHLVGSIHHDALGHGHLTDAHGQELLSAKPNIFHGHDLFLADGHQIGSTADLGGGHLHVQADPLIGMNGIRFPQFHA